MSYARAAELRKIDVREAALDVVAEVTIENAAPAHAPYHRANPDAPWTDEEVAAHRIRRTNAMTV
jgi:hypothetical protein